MHSYPHEFSEQLLQVITQSRALEFEALKGDSQAISQFQAHRSKVAPIPSSNHLREMLDAVFFSSLAQEEGQPVTFTLIYSDPDVAVESAWPCIRFNASLSLSTECIRKLSPAAPPRQVDIAVFPQDGSLRIWGLLYVRHSSPDQHSYPPGISITTLQTGVLSAKFGESELMSYSRGEAVFFDPYETINASGLRQLLAQVFAEDRPFPEKYQTAAILLGMCSVPLDFGAGATLLIVPLSHEVRGLDSPRYCADEVTCKALSVALVSPDQDHVAAAAARLFFIDGAVLFREGVGLLGAGAMIQTLDTGDFDISIIAPHKFLEKPIETTLSRFNGGARHRSALVFCYLNPGALAIVVSQDGVMSLLVRPLREERVYAIRPIRRGTRLA